MVNRLKLVLLAAATVAGTLVVLGCGSAAAGVAGDFPASGFLASNEAYAQLDDHSAAIKEEFPDQDARLADFSDLQAYHMEGGDLIQLFSDLGVPVSTSDREEVLLVSLDGHHRLDGVSHYFAVIFEGDIPPSHAAQRTIDINGTHTLSIGAGVERDTHLLVTDRAGGHDSIPHTHG